MKINNVIQVLEQWAPRVYQESYDNCGLLTGHAQVECIGVLCTLDVTEAVVEEAVQKKCNLIVAHHPVIFSGLKKLTGNNYVERTVIAAIRNNIAIYAIHTNLDNVLKGVNARIAEKIGLINCSILAPKSGLLMKLFCFVPQTHEVAVKNALFEAGAGNIGDYSHCSFSGLGTGTFKPGATTQPYVGKQGELHHEPESKIEVVFPAYLKDQVVSAMKHTHPYEEVAYDLITLSNDFQQVGSGLIGYLPEPMDPEMFFQMLKTVFSLSVIRHTALLDKKIQKIALCGGAGSFLTGMAIASGADIYISSDIKYHEFFDAENKIVVADIGHWESEQYTSELLVDILQSKFPTFAVLKSGIKTNPVHYFLG